VEVEVMTHEEKIDWMFHWAHEQKVVLELKGECGFGREGVGITSDVVGYPDYHWYNEEYQQIDDNHDVWTPEDAYHKHPCVAVLGRGVGAEEQLYKWLKWFDDNGYSVVTGDIPGVTEPITIMLGQHRYARMMKK
jgi:hypothetical protein